MYLCKILKYTCLQRKNVFVSNSQIYLYKIANGRERPLQRELLGQKNTLYLSKISKCICLKWQRETTTEITACLIKDSPISRSGPSFESTEK